MSRTSYPWTEWSDGEWRVLIPGVHFTCKPQSFQQNAYVAARRLDMEIETYIVNEGQVHLRLTEKNADEGDTP